MQVKASIMKGWRVMDDSSSPLVLPQDVEEGAFSVCSSQGPQRTWTSAAPGMPLASLPFTTFPLPLIHSPSGSFCGTPPKYLHPSLYLEISGGPLPNLWQFSGW
jgi:hypothetical protein